MLPFGPTMDMFRSEEMQLMQVPLSASDCDHNVSAAELTDLHLVL